MIDPKTFGLMAEFDNVNHAIIAARRTYAAGYRKLDAYSPFPVEELSEAIGFHKNGVALVCLVGGLLGVHGSVHAAVVDQYHQLPGQHRRTSAALLAVFHYCQLRDDHFVRGIVGGFRHAGIERTADALPSSV